MANALRSSRLAISCLNKIQRLPRPEYRPRQTIMLVLVAHFRLTREWGPGISDTSRRRDLLTMGDPHESFQIVSAQALAHETSDPAHESVPIVLAGHTSTGFRQGGRMGVRRQGLVESL